MTPEVSHAFSLQQAEYEKRGLELLQLASRERLPQRRSRYLVAARRFFALATRGHAAALDDLRAYPF